MPGAAAEFRSRFQACANKIDLDPGIPVPERQSFWSDLDQFEPAEVEDAFKTCCRDRQFVGPKVQLEAGENLGHASTRDTLVNTLSSSGTGAVPGVMPDEARSIITTVTEEPDPAAALTLFKLHFSGLLLRQWPIFAFRGDAPAADPLACGSFPELFERLAIAGADAPDYLLLAFTPPAGKDVHQPTCLNAGLKFCDIFQPGGLTAPGGGLQGLPEVLTQPPPCDNITVAPRKIE